MLYVWEWFGYCDYAMKNSKTLQEIKVQNEQILQVN